MRKLVLIVCLFFISFSSFSQRVADLQFTMTSPSNNAVINSTQAFSFTGTLKNNGPDTIKTTDTLVFAFILDNASALQPVVVNGQTYQEIATTLQSPMGPGVSGNINLSVGFATAPVAGSHNLCVAAIALNRSADSVTDDSINNNKSCITFTETNTTAVAGISNNTDVASNAYPNPATTEMNIDLNLPSPRAVAVTMTDLTGKIMYRADKGTMPSGKSVLHINTGDLPAGIYLYQVTAGTELYRGRIAVVR